MALVLPPEGVLRTAAFAAAVAQTTTAPNPAQQPPSAMQQPVPEAERVIALDRALAAIDKSAIAPKNHPGVKADPPLYLRNNDTWLTASDVTGPWSPTGKLPPSFAKLPADDNWKDVKAHIPGRPPAAGAVPMVYASTSPAEMLLLQGAPVYQPVPGTSLLWVSNTDSDVFPLGNACEGFIYFSEDGDLVAVRAGHWKAVFMEQRCPGTMRIWAEPFTPLRGPDVVCGY